jgi:hypothetical protein
MAGKAGPFLSELPHSLTKPRGDNAYILADRLTCNGDVVTFKMGRWPAPRWLVRPLNGDSDKNCGT